MAIQDTSIQVNNIGNFDIRGMKFGILDHNPKNTKSAESAILLIGTIQQIVPLQQIKILKNVQGIKLKSIHWFKWSTSLLLDISLKVLCFRKI